jgi:hypothetical protein
MPINDIVKQLRTEASDTKSEYREKLLYSAAKLIEDLRRENRILRNKIESFDEKEA